jgi:hypothetical protein
MKNNYLAKQKRQFKGLCKKISKNWDRLSTNQRESLLTRFRRLYGNLKSAFARPALRKMMGAAAVVLMTAGGMQAQTFAAPVQNPFGLSGADLSGTLARIRPTLVDIDGDGDLDLFSGRNDGSFYFHENIGTSSVPNFTAAIKDTFGLADVGAQSIPVFADMDGDGDMDMISGENGGSLYYFENTGTSTTPAFAVATTITIAPTPTLGGASRPAIGDIDNDGDFDLIVGSYDGSNFGYQVFFFRNDGSSSSPNFTWQTPTGLPATTGYTYTSDWTPTLVDIDGDLDLDLFAFGMYNNHSYYYENQGSPTSPNTAAAATDTFNLALPSSGVVLPRIMGGAFGDLDNDGDLDLLASLLSAPPLGGTPENYYYYYENDSTITSTRILDGAKVNFNIYPNPVSEQLNIELAQAADYQISVTDLTGREIYNSFIQADNNLQLSTQSWPAGLYLLQVRDEEGRVETKKVVKN